MGGDEFAIIQTGVRSRADVGALSDRVIAAIGVIWIVGRHIYMVSYVKDPKTRSRGFGLQALATLLLFLIALIGAVINLIPQ